MEAIWNYYPEGYSITYVEIEDGKPYSKLKIAMNDREGSNVEIYRRSSPIPKRMWEEDKKKKINDLKSEKQQMFIKRIFTYK